MRRAEDNVDARSESLNAATTQARLITIVLVIGLLLFAGVVAGVNSALGPLAPGASIMVPMLAAIAGLMLLIGLLAGVIMGRSLNARVRRGEEIPIERISSVVILQAALIEGPSLLAAVTALLGGLPYLLITLIGCALLIVRWMGLSDRMRDMAGLGATYTWR